MTSEVLKPYEFSRQLNPDIKQEIRGPIVITRVPDFKIQVALAKLQNLNAIYRALEPDGQRNIVSTTDMEDGRFLVVHAPPEVVVRKKLSEAQKNSKKSSAVYVVEYKAPTFWVLVQAIHGKATRHSHPGALEAFTLLDAEEYGIHDEINNETELISTNGIPKFVDIREINRDHQCFSYRSPSIALIVLTGENVTHNLLPSMSDEYLIQRAEQIRQLAGPL